MRRIFSVALCIAILAVAGCGKNKHNTDANIRFVNASPDSGSVSVRLNTDTSDFASGIAYQSATSYKAIGAGTQEIKFISASGGTQIDTTYSLTTGANYTLVMFGSASASVGTLLSDDTTTPAAGNMKLRLAHAASGIGAIDVYTLPQGTDLNSTNARIPSIAPGSASAFLEFQAGAYRIVITAAGRKEALYDSGMQTFADKGVATVLAYSSGSSKLVNGGILLSDSAGTSTFSSNPYARIKTLNAAPDYASIDTLVDGSVAFSNIPYKGMSSYLIVASGARNLKVEATTAPGTYIANSSATLDPGHDYSLVVTEQNGAAQLISLADSNLPPSLGRDRVRFVNATTDKPSLDVLVNFTKEVSALARGAASPYIEIDVNIYDFTFTVAGSTVAVLDLPSVTLDANQRYTIYVVGNGTQLAGVVTIDN